MQEFEGRVAVITGAASGIGRGIARQCATEGMKIVLSDVDRAGLKESLELVTAEGASAIVHPTDVRHAGEVAALGRAAVEAFGGVHLVFNNAGVMLTGVSWDRTDEDWRWVLDVNLFGVIHGLRTFVPILRSNPEGGHIVNTASVGGLVVSPFLSPYLVSKHAVVALTEATFYELEALKTNVGISVLCPGAVATGIADSQRIRPEDQSQTQSLASDAEKTFDELLNVGIGMGKDPIEVGRIVFEGLRTERFWIYTDPIYEDSMRSRLESMIEGTPPVFAQELGEDLLSQD